MARAFAFAAAIAPGSRIHAIQPHMTVVVRVCIAVEDALDFGSRPNIFLS